MTDVRVQENVVVGQGGQYELKADVFQPEGQDGPTAAVVLLPGGGWQTCVRAGQVDRYGYKLAQRGLVTVVAEYRVMDQDPWPAQIHDVKAALRWVRANANDLGVDPNRIVVCGSSAGGHLALIAGGETTGLEGDGGNPGISSEVAAVVAIYPVTDVSELAHRPERAPMFGANPSEALIREATPLSYAQPGYPPTMMVHGTADTRVHHSMTTRMYDALDNAGVQVDLHLFAGQDHIFDTDPRFSEPIADFIALFVERYVPAPEAMAVAADN
jgi:acetyl esterase/lipase